MKLLLALRGRLQLISGFALLALLPVSSLFSQTTAQFSAIDAQGDLLVGTDTTFTLRSSGCYIYGIGSPFCVITTTLGFNVTKFDPDGTPVSSFVANGSDTGGAPTLFLQVLTAMAVDGSGNLYIAGPSIPGYPSAAPATSYGAHVPPANRVSWIALLNGQTGSVVYSTYFDGDVAHLLVDPQGNLTACGSKPQPTLQISFGAAHLEGTTVGPYCARLDPTLSRLQFATTIGGNGGDQLTSAVLDASGNLYVAGEALSVPGNPKASAGLDPFLTSPGALRQMSGQQNIFAAKFAPSGALVYSAVFGSSGSDTLQAIAVDGSGDLYLAGVPGASDFPSTAGQKVPFNPGTFVSKLSPDASTLLYGTGLPLSASSLFLASDGQGDLYLAAAVTGLSSFTPTSQASSYCTEVARGNPNGLSAGVEAEFAGDGSVLLTTYIPFPSPSPFFLYPDGKVTIAGRLSALDTFDPRMTSSGVLCALNSANFQDEGITAGELITIFGSSLGPVQPVASQPVNGLIPTSAGGVTVTIGGKSAPILYASEDQINAVAPFSLPLNQPTTIQVTNNGVALNSIQYATGAQEIGVFTLDNTPYTDAIAYNQDGTRNSASNPAAKGSTISLLGTGFGPQQPLPPDGSTRTGASLSFPPLQVFADDPSALAASFFDVPGFVAGVVRMNLMVPVSLPDTGKVSLSLGGAIYVQ